VAVPVLKQTDLLDNPKFPDFGTGIGEKRERIAMDRGTIFASYKSVQKGRSDQWKKERRAHMFLPVSFGRTFLS